MRIRLGAMLALATVSWGAGPSSAQVLRELGPIRLEYVVHTQAGPAGTAEVRFEPADTPRGRRLQVSWQIRYGLGTEDPVSVVREGTLSCDEEGIEKFDARASVGDVQRRYLGIRRGADFHITVTRTENGEASTSQKTETADVRRSNVGLFAAGYLEDPPVGGDLIRDYPMLYPAAGRHYPGQRTQEGVAPVRTPSGETISVASSKIRRLSGARDKLWHLNDERMPLIRMEENSEHGLLVYELVSVDGRDVDWAAAVASQAP